MPISTLYSALKDLSAWALGRWRNRLSPEESSLISEIFKNNSQAYILTSDQTGDFLRVGAKSYYAQGNETLRVTYLEMFNRLVTLGYITHESGVLYRLSLLGINTAQKSMRST